MTFSATAQIAQAPVAPGKVIKVDTVHPSASEVYDIIIGQSILSEAGTLIRLKLGLRRCIIVTDASVGSLYSTRLEAVLAASGHEVVTCITVASGEASKDFATLQVVLDKMLAVGLDSRTLVVLLGGGVVCDLGGMAASLALMGLDFVQIPTTLLAQVTSTIGGNTALHTRYGPNTLGHFHAPRLVLTDVTLLDSLTLREMRAGYTEILKYSLSFDAAFFHWCQSHGGRLVNGNHEAQIYAIGFTCSAKSKMASQLGGSNDQRCAFDLGQTFTSMLEMSRALGPTWLYGDASAVGILMACQLSVRLGFCPTSDYDEICEHYRVVGLCLKAPLAGVSLDTLFAQESSALKSLDKKKGIVLLRGIGKAFVSEDVDMKDIRAIWEEFVCP